MFPEDQTETNVERTVNVTPTIAVEFGHLKDVENVVKILTVLRDKTASKLSCFYY